MSDRKLRILALNHRDWQHPRAGGVEEVVRQTTTRWAAGGHDVRLLVSNFPGATETDLTLNGVRILRRGSEESFNWSVPIRHRSLFAEADVIVENLSKVACMLPLWTSRPVVGYFYHLFGKSLYGNVAWPVAVYVEIMERLAVRVYSRCPAIVISNSTASDLTKHGMPTAQMQVVYCGVDLSLFQTADAAMKTSHPSILWVGRVRKTKGVDLAVAAFTEVLKAEPTAHLTIAGTGDYAAELQHSITARGLDRSITLTGYLSEVQLREQMQQAWVLTYPSPKEGWGLCVIEAAACGTPSVASNSPGLCEAVQDGKTGFLVPHGDIPALAEKLLLLLRDTPLRQRMGTAALEWARHLNWDRTAAEALAVLQTAAAKSK